MHDWLGGGGFKETNKDLVDFKGRKTTWLVNNINLILLAENT